MPITYPIPVSDFQDKIKISGVTFFLSSPREVNRTAGGAQITASLGDAIWTGTFSTPPTNDRSVSAKVDALLSVLDRAGSSVLLYAPEKTHPADDPDGSKLGAATPTIDGLSSLDARIMAIAGLPVGYVLSPGDLIGWQYGSSPVRYALHRIVDGGTAGAGGKIVNMEVTPFIEPGATVGTPVQLIKPVIKAVIRPGPDYGSHRPVVSSGKEFSFVQTMR